MADAMAPIGANITARQKNKVYLSAWGRMHSSVQIERSSSPLCAHKLRTTNDQQLKTSD
jgi:hypothetical protein